MSKTTYKFGSIWCIPASHADGVLVMLSYSNTRRGMRHLMRWTPGAGLEPGAWTSLRFARRECIVDPTGEFLMYTAKTTYGRYDVHKQIRFLGAAAGGYAISRSPWISALTDIKGLGYSWRGGGPSRHALSPEEQAALWALFSRESMCADWFAIQQPGWTVSPVQAESWNWPRRSGLDRKIRARNLSTDPLTRQVLRAKHGRAGHGTLLVRLPEYAEITHLEFAWADASGVVHELRDVVWAQLRRDDTLLTATRDGFLKWHTRRDCVIGGLAECWQVRESLDCSERTPNPSPSPDWARAPLRS